MPQRLSRAIPLIAVAMIVASVLCFAPGSTSRQANPDIRAAAPAWAAANCPEHQSNALTAAPVLRQSRDALLAGATHFEAISEEQGIDAACAEAFATAGFSARKARPDIVARAIALFEP